MAGGRGIADYVRHKYYEKDIQQKPELDKNGTLKGLEAYRNRHDFARKGYLDG